MGAFIIAGILVVVTIGIALASEFARGMATNPGAYPSRFFGILAFGFVVAILVAATHWLPSIGW